MELKVGIIKGDGIGPEIVEEAMKVLDKVELNKIFVENKEFKNLYVTVLSFGFKYGIPSDADLVFDVRFLPDPYMHVKEFLDICSTIRFQNFSDESIQLRLFPFSLKDLKTCL